MSRYKEISIDKIPSFKFEGYYWMSDSSKPQIIRNQEIEKSVFGKLPFVVEANFYSKEKEISIQVKNIDGKYRVAQIDVQGCEPITYIGHDIESDFLVVEAWEDVEDSLLENMTTKVPTWTAFKGFVKPVENEKQ